MKFFLKPGYFNLLHLHLLALVPQNFLHFLRFTSEAFTNHFAPSPHDLQFPNTRKFMTDAKLEAVGH
jgi:hypothetical protein